MFVSWTSNLLVRMYDFQICTKVLPKLILSLQDLRQSQSPETVPTCIVVQCFPHDNIACIHSCDECMRSNVPNVCRMLLSIWVTARANLFTDPRMSGLPMRAKHMLLQLIDFLLLWIGGRPCMALRRWKIGQLFCSPIRNICPCISLHDLPYHKTMRKCSRQVSQNKVVFQKLLQRFCIQTYFCNCPHYFCLFDILFDCNPNKRGQGISVYE